MLCEQNYENIDVKLHKKMFVKYLTYCCMFLIIDLLAVNLINYGWTVILYWYKNNEDN